jgi:hypothetical protein
MIVYTAITNEDSLLEQPSAVCVPGVKFYAFANRVQPSETWEILPVANSPFDSRLNTIYHKVCPHLIFPQEEVSLWIDRKLRFSFGTSVLKWADYLLDNVDIAIFPHDEQHCIYQHAASCIHEHPADRSAIRAQIYHYTQELCPANIGLADCRVILRRHSDAMRQFNELWWSEILKTSPMDGISFSYLLWRTGMKVRYFPGTISDGSLFQYPPPK